MDLKAKIRKAFIWKKNPLFIAETHDHIYVRYILTVVTKTTKFFMGKPLSNLTHVNSNIFFTRYVCAAISAKYSKILTEPTRDSEPK